MAAAFGLVHGFGSRARSSALHWRRCAGCRPSGAFNLGIEVAQVAVALALVPLLYVLTRRASLVA